MTQTRDFGGSSCDSNVGQSRDSFQRFGDHSKDYDIKYNMALDLLKSSKISKAKAKEIKKCLTEMKTLFEREIERNKTLNEELNGFRSPRKDSFDRFGDDLTELILSYLHIEDKTRLECVSKQWKRVIYQKVLFLDVLNYKPRRLKKIECFRGKYKYCIHKNDAELCLKKWSNIREIEIKEISIDISLAEIFDKFCPHLKSLYLYDCDLSVDAMNVFEGLGPKIKELKIYTEPLISQYQPNEQILKFCPNIESIDCSDHSVIADKSIFLPKLKSLTIKIDKNNVSFSTDFCLRYGNQLKTLKISTIVPQNRRRLSSDDFIHVFTSIASLRGIIDLDIELHSTRNGITISNQLTLIGDNCRQLKRLSLFFYRLAKIEGNFFQSLRKFDSLEKLDICSDFEETNQSLEEMGLKRNIKFLTLRSNISEKKFANIHQFVPNLKKLFMTSIHGLADNLLNALSELKSLRILWLKHTNMGFMYITDSDLKVLLDKCPQLREVVINSSIGITNKTIEILIEFAKKIPKQKFVFRCEINNSMNVIDIKAFVIPENLKIFLIPKVVFQ